MVAVIYEYIHLSQNLHNSLKINEFYLKEFYLKYLKEPIEFKPAAFCQSYSLNIYITKVGRIRMNEFNI